MLPGQTTPNGVLRVFQSNRRVRTSIAFRFINNVGSTVSETSPHRVGFRILAELFDCSQSISTLLGEDQL